MSEATEAPDWVVDQDIDSVLGGEVNVEDTAATLKAGLPPAGTYQSDPEQYPLSAFVDKDKAGRRVITLQGIAVFKGGESKARIRVKLSPDTREGKVYVDGQDTGESTGKPDSKSLRWAEAVRAYQQTFKENPKREANVVEYLKTSPIKFRMFQGSEDLACANISAGK